MISFFSHSIEQQEQNPQRVLFVAENKEAAFASLNWKPFFQLIQFCDL